jgi:hypothetical protein
MFHKKNVLRIISVVAISTIVLMGCNTEPETIPVPTTAETADTTDTADTTNTNGSPSLMPNIGTKIEPAPEGMLLTFTDIPADATTMFINVYEDTHDGRQWSDVFGIVLGPKLEEIKKTKKLICPFIKKDQSYAVSVQLMINDVIQSTGDAIEIIPTQDGIYLANEIELQLNDAQTGVTLSAEPEFSAPVEFNINKYDYTLLFFPDTFTSTSGGIYSGNELSAEFVPNTINLIKENAPTVSGTFPAHVIALSNINYKGIAWKVLVARTEEFELNL